MGRGGGRGSCMKHVPHIVIHTAQWINALKNASSILTFPHADRHTSLHINEGDATEAVGGCDVVVAGRQNYAVCSPSLVRQTKPAQPPTPCTSLPYPYGHCHGLKLVVHHKIHICVYMQPYVCVWMCECTVSCVCAYFTTLCMKMFINLCMLCLFIYHWFVYIRVFVSCMFFF